jgi:hypothetical protein
MHIVINSQHKYYIYIKDILEECDMEENLERTGAVTASCSKRRMQKVFSDVTYFPSHRQAGAIMINIQSTLRTAPDLCKIVSLAVQFDSIGNSCTIYMQEDICIYTLVLHNIDTLVGQRNKRKLGKQ